MIVNAKKLRDKKNYFRLGIVQFSISYVYAWYICMPSKNDHYMTCISITYNYILMVFALVSLHEVNTSNAIIVPELQLHSFASVSSARKGKNTKIQVKNTDGSLIYICVTEPRLEALRVTSPVTSVVSIYK